jgi:signal transduction histidine kinase
MTHVPSLRLRVLIGAVLWTFGLVTGSSAMLARTFENGQHAAAILHGYLSHTAVVAAIALLCLVVGAWQVRQGLSSLGMLRKRLSAVHHGDVPRVEGAYPSEVQPLVDDLNALLEHRERLVQRAVTKAGDLAHGLKTPLAILAQEADRVESAGHVELGSSLNEQVGRMRRQIDYHLAQARAAASGAVAVGVRTSVEAASAALAHTLRRLYAERRLDIDVCTPAGHEVRCQREDLDEMLGNLMDNACKWARTRVTVTSAQDGTTALAIVVSDDGPGLDPAMQSHVLRRGVRLDEAVPGSGLGLAIVRDLAELYGGSLTLDRSREGGLSARLLLPAAHLAGG